jgi:hypothetical protein
MVSKSERSGRLSGGPPEPVRPVGGPASTLRRTDREIAEPDMAGRADYDSAGQQRPLCVHKSGQDKVGLLLRRVWGAPEEDHARAEVGTKSEELAEIRVRGDDNPVFSHRNSHDVFVRMAEKPAVTYVHGVMAGFAQEARHPRRQGLVD